MRKLNQLIILLILTFCYVQHLNAQENKQWYQDKTWRPGNFKVKAKTLPLIKVQGNKFVDPEGKTVLFRGIAISDPDKVERQGHWNKVHFEKIKELGANVVRIPIHPSAWRERTPEKYIQLLDQAVEWCTDLGMYVMLDWHSIGNLETGLFQDPMYNTSKQETYEFWRTISTRYSGQNTVAFYELFNEPTTYNGQLGPVSWADWKKTMETTIAIIRTHDKETIPLVAGFDWAYDLTPIREEPLSVEGIGYVTHPYPFKRPAPWLDKWEEAFGFASAKYPVVATEFGIDVRTGTIDPEGNSYGTQIIGYLEGKGISWMIWVFDPEWGGSKIKNWNYELTPGGEFFKKAMHGELKVQKELNKK